MLLPLLAAGFVYVNTTAINADQLLALEPTKDNKGCLIHLITKNPFQVDEPCTNILNRVEATTSTASASDYTPALAGAALGLVLGGGIGFAAAAGRRRA